MRSSSRPQPRRRSWIGSNTSSGCRFPKELRATLDDRLFRVWRENPGTIEWSEALAADDDLRGFAQQLDNRFQIVDLRSPEIGMGFSWGRYGPRTEVRRHGFQRLFAHAPPDRKPGLLRRVLG